ncbi:hypothetical protein VCHENC02_2952, partial [Vibrio harveyi]
MLKRRLQVAALHTASVILLSF